MVKKYKLIPSDVGSCELNQVTGCYEEEGLIYVQFKYKTKGCKTIEAKTDWYTGNVTNHSCTTAKLDKQVVAVEGFQDGRGRKAASGMILQTLSKKNYTVGLVTGSRYQS